MALRLVQGYYFGGGGGGPVTTATALFTPDTTSRFVNPECGPYGWVYNDGGSWIQQFTSSNLSGLRSASFPRTLVMGFLDLRSYVSSSLPGSYMTDLNTRLGYVRSAGLKVIIRPCYNYSDGGTDATLSRIQSHMASLAATWEANKDVIFCFQMGWLGAWGEFHDGSTGGDENAATKLAVMQSFMANTPAEIPIQARYPADIMTWFPTVITQSQFNAGLSTPTNQTRLGLFNDGYLAGSTDSGTYGSRPGANSFTASAMRAYAAAQTGFTPSVGEVTTYANTPWRTSMSDATGDGSTYHMGSLNFESSSGPAFFTQWAADGTDVVIARNYGYRIQLDSVTYPTSATARGSAAAISVDLRDNGYSRVHRQRPLVVSLRHTSTGEIYSASADDLRKLAPNAASSTTFSANVSIPPGATTGNYAVLLSAPDTHASLATDARYALRFANANAGSQSWDGTNARWNTGATIPVV